MTEQSTRVPLAEASAEQIRTFATTVLGITLTEKAGVEKLRAEISKVWTEPTIVLMESQPAAGQTGGTSPTDPGINHTATASSRAMVDRTSKLDPKVTLIINREPGPGGDRPVPVSVNGVTILVPRGVQAEVPYRYYEALNNAVQTLIEQDPITLEEFSRDVPSYPFQVVGALPSDADVAAWRSKVSAAMAS